MSIDFNFDFDSATITQKIAFIGACIMLVNTLLGFFGIGVIWSSIVLRIIFGIIGLFVAFVAALHSHVLEIPAVKLPLSNEHQIYGIWFIVIGVIGVFTCGIIGSWVVMAAGILYIMSPMFDFLD